MSRNPNWTRDELLVALDYFLDNRQDHFAPTGDGVIDLAAKIGAVTKALGLSGDEALRNADGVSMKLLNFRAHDPSHTSKGLQRGNKLEKVVWDEYADQPEALKAVVLAILANTADTGEVGAPVVSADEDIEVAEGRLLTRQHRYRERDRTIVKRKKASFLKRHGHLRCEACGFDFAAVYGARGEGFIECHHTKPVSELKPGEKTKLADLVLLCANCHRMVHVARPWWTM